MLLSSYFQPHIIFSSILMTLIINFACLLFTILFYTPTFRFIYAYIITTFLLNLLPYTTAYSRQHTQKITLYRIFSHDVSLTLRLIRSYMITSFNWHTCHERMYAHGNEISPLSLVYTLVWNIINLTHLLLFYSHTSYFDTGIYPMSLLIQMTVNV